MALPRVFCLVLVLLYTLPAHAHEFWIDTPEFQVESGMPVIASLRNGEGFKGHGFVWFDRRIVRFDQYLGTTKSRVTGRAGDVPAINIPPQADGLLRLAHQSALQTITYREAKKFRSFVDHKDLSIAKDIAPAFPLKEGYTRYVKALIAIGAGTGQDDITGLETEFVALANPYTDPLPNGLPVKLLYQGEPRANAQIEVFERLNPKTVTVFTLRTDADGTAHIPVKSGHSYLLDAVVLRKPSAAFAETHDIHWESLWAAMTFAIPD